ncbi:hypothetical protein NPIL_555841 [Nephila pilipes]|uniref:Uncharacterized protein n=1 Tax=Nephila pilipes TaxID=299642 RepID=A0A8X6Q6L1_NEPPI|nr:hypothetical protein NPIL_555841 [Nephila pilipes]
MNCYTNSELTNIHFVYGKANENGAQLFSCIHIQRGASEIIKYSLKYIRAFRNLDIGYRNFNDRNIKAKKHENLGDLEDEMRKTLTIDL